MPQEEITASPAIAPAEIEPVTEAWAVVAGHRMRYLRAGSGPPVLLIHGLMAYSFSWRFTVPALAPVRSVIAPDLLGAGFSERPKNMDSNVEAAARRLLEFMTQVGVPAADVVGTSHGGGIAVTMAALAPERVKKLVLVDPVNPWSAHGQLLSRIFANPVGRLAFTTMHSVIEAMGTVWLRRLFGDARRIPPDSLEGYSRPIKLAGSWEYGLDIMRTWRDDLRKLEQHYSSLRDKPALVIFGDRDRAVFPSSAQEIMKRLSSAKLVMMPGVGHMPYEEVPEEFNRILLDYLA